MAATATKTEKLSDALNSGDIAKQASAMQRMSLGAMLEPIINTVSQTSATTITLSPAALMVQSARVTAGAAASGLRQIGDSAATASATVAKLSDDGKTLTFEAGVTAAIVVYVARAATDPDTKYATT